MCNIVVSIPATRSRGRHMARVLPAKKCRLPAPGFGVHPEQHAAEPFTVVSVARRCPATTIRALHHAPRYHCGESGAPSTVAVTKRSERVAGRGAAPGARRSVPQPPPALGRPYLGPSIAHLSPRTGELPVQASP